MARRLREARRARFVGREAELALFQRLLERPVPGVLYLHVPGGVGKTALLTTFAGDAAGRDVVRLDPRLVELLWSKELQPAAGALRR